MWIPKGAAVIKGRRLYGTRRLLEEIRYGNNFFQISAEKYPNKVYWFQISKFFVLNKNENFEKFKCAGIKHDNSFFKFYLKKKQIRHFWSQIFRFCILKNFRVLISNIKMVFQNCIPKHLDKMSQAFSFAWNFVF